MQELCFNEGVGGLLAYWQSGKQKILCLGDDLSIGPIAGGPDSQERRKQLVRILGSDPWGELPAGEWIDEAWQRYCRTWERLRTLPEGTEVRVWLDRTPGSRCGFLASAEALAFRKARVTAALLPEWVARSDGTAVEYSGWGEAGPEELEALLEDLSLIHIWPKISSSQTWLLLIFGLASAIFIAMPILYKSKGRRKYPRLRKTIYFIPPALVLASYFAFLALSV